MSEAKAWQELSDPERQKHGAIVRDSFGTSPSNSLQKEARGIAKAKSEQIDAIEEVRRTSIPEGFQSCRHLLQQHFRRQISAEGQKMMESML